MILLGSSNLFELLQFTILRESLPPTNKMSFFFFFLHIDTFMTLEPLLKKYRLAAFPLVLHSGICLYLETFAAI